MAFGYQGITYPTKQKVVELGPLQQTAETKKILPLPPIGGAIALVGVIVFLVVGKKQG